MIPKELLAKTRLKFSGNSCEESKFDIFVQIIFNIGQKKGTAMSLKPSVKQGGVSVMVWGCILATDVGDLIKILLPESHLEVHHQILIHGAIPSG